MSVYMPQLTLFLLYQTVFAFARNHFYIAKKKKKKIKACAKIIRVLDIKVHVIYSVMYAIRNFLNGNDN